MKVNEFVRPTAEEQFSEEDVAKVINAEVNGKWTKMSLEEILAFHDRIGGTDNG